MDQQEQNEQFFQIDEIQLQYNNENWLDKLVPLNEKKILIYFDGGEWILYNIITNQEELKGKIANNVKVFYQVWDGTLFYVCPDTLIVKLIDFTTGSTNPAYEFPASQNHNAQSEQYIKDTIAEKLIFGQTQYQDSSFLVTIEQQRQYANESPAIIYVRNIKKNYDDGPSGLEQVLYKYEYPNATLQTDMFIYNTDPQSLVLFGQDFQNGQMEFALIKPHLGNKALRVIKIQDDQSYTLVNVTNWLSDNQIAIWLNNNDDSAEPIIQIIDQRLYYDSQNNTYRDEEVLWKVDKVFVQFQLDPPQTLIDVIFFPLGCQYSVIQRLVGVEPYISLIDWKNHTIVHEYYLGDWNYIIPQNRDYIIHYDDNQDERSGSIFIKLFQWQPNPRQLIDERFHVLQFMEYSNVIKNYGIEVLYDIFQMMNK